MTEGSADVPRCTVAMFRAAKRYLSCECGFAVAASELGDLIEAAKHHARQAHRMSLSDEQLTSLARDLDDGSLDTGRTTPAR